MSFLRRFDFNKKTGWVSLILFSIGISLLVFAAVYLAEGLSWLNAEDAGKLDVYEEVGWNWVRGSGLAFVTALILLAVSHFLLRKNRHSNKPAKPLFGRLDLNKPKGYLGVVFISVSLVFFFNAALYQIEVLRWVYAGIELGREWYLAEAGSWNESAATMKLVGTALAGCGLLALTLNWKRT